MGLSRRRLGTRQKRQIGRLPKGLWTGHGPTIGNRRALVKADARNLSQQALVKAELRPGMPHFRRADDAAAAHDDRMQLALDLFLPEIEKTAQLGKSRREVVILPDKTLQQRRMIRQAGRV